MDSSDDLQVQPNQWTAPQGPALVDGAADLTGARDRAAAFLQERTTRPGVMGRRLMGHPSPGDLQLTDHLIREGRRRTRIDGSKDGALFPTAWTTWELLDLGCPPDHAAVVRTVGYVLTRQDRPGRYGEGCTPERHERKRCRHFLQGFFSPGSWDDEIAPLQLPSGLVISDEEAARFALSCVALRVVLRARQDGRTAVCRHVESLLGMDELWEGSPTWWSLDLSFLAAGAVALAPLQFRAQADERMRRLLDQQLPDGSWQDAHFFNALDMLMSSSTPEVRGAIKRAVPLLMSLQQDSGAFDESGNEEMVLIALRAFRIAEKP